MRDLTRITDDIAGQLASRAGDIMHRMSPEGRRQRDRARARRRAHMLKIARRAVLAAFAILIAAMGYGLFVGPLGDTGVMAVGLAMILTLVGIFVFSSTAPETRATLTATDLPQLPARTEAWLVAQRTALPAPAVRLADGIALRLEAIAPQLTGLDPADPAAFALRKLMAEDLPELVEGYKRVPEPLRTQPINGRPSPDRQLAEGLQVVDDELKRMCEQLASGELTKLATQGRYLEIKYKGDEGLK